MNVKRIIPIAGLLTSALLMTPMVASADTVGVPGEPNCFGTRISHGSSDHGLTPAMRASFLQEQYDASSPEEQAFFTELLSIKNGIINAGVQTRWVRLNCSGDFEF